MTRALTRRAALALAALGSACAAGGPLLEPATAPILVPVGGAAVPARDGAALALSRWGPEEPRAVILALHGFGDYGPSTFGPAAAAWAALGIATLAYDQRGFGRNPSRGFWPGAERLVTDLEDAVAEARRRHPCAPLVVLGHSMGGGVAMAAAPRLGGRIDGLVLAAPAIWGGDALNPMHRAAAWLAAATVPDKRFTGRGVVRIRPSDNIEMLRALGRDPLYLGPPSAREIMGLVRVIDRAAAAAAHVRMPALLLLGERDEIAPGRAVERVFAEVLAPAETIRYADGWHMLFRDLQAPRVWADVAAWVLARPPRSVAAAGCASSVG